MKFSSCTTVYIGDPDPDWWSNDEEYNWAFDKSGRYEALITKRRDRTLVVRLKVPGENEITLESPAVAPARDGRLSVFLQWDVIEGYLMALNGRNTSRVPLPRLPRSPQD